MKYLHLIWAALFRSKTRTLLTLLSVVAAFLLFGMLDSVRVAFNSSANVEGYDRLITTSKLSITQSLPYSLLTQIESTPGVANVSYATWFGGIYQDPNELLRQLRRRARASWSCTRSTCCRPISCRPSTLSAPVPS